MRAIQPRGLIFDAGDMQGRMDSEIIARPELMDVDAPPNPTNTSLPPSRAMPFEAERGKAQGKFFQYSLVSLHLPPISILGPTELMYIRLVNFRNDSA